MKKVTSLFVLALLSLSATVVQANDFPTLERVEYVFGCMEAKGKEDYNTMYQCSCMIDRIAQSFTSAEYAEAQTFAMLRRTPGERGSLFRDPPRAKTTRQKLKEVSEAAKKACLAG